MSTLKKKDLVGRAAGRPSEFWVTEDIDEFVQESRVNSATPASVPWATYDFTTMYEALELDRLLTGLMEAAALAWAFEEEAYAAANGLVVADGLLKLSICGWKAATELGPTPSIVWFDRATLQNTIRTLLANLYVCTGGVLRRKIAGIPMGLNAESQMANL